MRIHNEGTSSTMVVHKTHLLDVKPEKLFVGRLLHGSSLVFEHILTDFGPGITRPGQVYGRKYGQVLDIRLPNRDLQLYGRISLSRAGMLLQAMR